MNREPRIATQILAAMIVGILLAAGAVLLVKYLKAEARQVWIRK